MTKLFGLFGNKSSEIIRTEPLHEFTAAEQEYIRYGSHSMEAIFATLLELARKNALRINIYFIPESPHTFDYAAKLDLLEPTSELTTYERCIRDAIFKDATTLDLNDATLDTFLRTFDRYNVYLGDVLIQKGVYKLYENKRDLIGKYEGRFNVTDREPSAMYDSAIDTSKTPNSKRLKAEANAFRQYLKHTKSPINSSLLIRDLPYYLVDGSFDTVVYAGITEQPEIVLPTIIFPTDVTTNVAKLKVLDDVGFAFLNNFTQRMFA